MAYLRGIFQVPIFLNLSCSLGVTFGHLLLNATKPMIFKSLPITSFALSSSRLRQNTPFQE